MKWLLLAFTFVSVLLLTSTAQSQVPAWSTSVDLHLHGRQNVQKLLKAPNDGFYVFCDNGFPEPFAVTTSQVVYRLDDTGAILWTHEVPGESADAAANSTGIAIVGRGGEQNAVYSLVTKFDDSGNMLWSRQLGTPIGAPDAVAMDSAGNVVVAAAASAQNPSGPLVIEKLDGLTGATRFSSFRGTPQLVNTYDQLVIDNSGSIFASGRVGGDCILVKYDANGNLLWSQTNTNIARQFIAIDSSGDSYVAFNDSVDGFMQVNKFDPNGTLLWNYNSDGYDEAFGCTVDSSGNLFISFWAPDIGIAKISSNGTLAYAETTTSAYSFANPVNVPIVVDGSDNAYINAVQTGGTTGVLLQFDPTGALAWAKSVSNKQNGYSEGNVVTISDTGHAIWVTNFPTPNPFDIAARVASFDSAGNNLWITDCDAPFSQDVMLSSVTDSAGNTYSLGEGGSNGTPTSNQACIAKMSPSGAVWTKYFAPLPSAFMFPIKSSPTGGVAACQAGPMIWRYDASGNLMWTASPAMGKNQVTDFTLGPDGSVYVAMTGFVGTGNDHLTRVVKFASNGVIAWTVDRVGAKTDVPGKIGVDSNGNAFVRFVYNDASLKYRNGLEKISSDGALLWSVDVGPNINGSTVGDVKIDGGGNVILSVLAPDSTSAIGDSTRFYKYDANHQLLWNRTFFPGRSAVTNGTIALDSSNDVFTCGTVDINSGNQTFGVQRINADGTIARGTTSPNKILALAPDNVGGVYGGANYTGKHGIDYAIVKYDQTGAMIWPASGLSFVNHEWTQDIGNWDNPLTNLGTDSAGNLYAAGAAYGSSGTIDLNVVKFTRSESAFANQIIPTTMATGQTYQVTYAFRNTGFDVWTTASGYRLLNLDNVTWSSGGGTFANADQIEPGSSKAFTFSVIAPITPGTYPIQTKMYRMGSGTFGALSPIAMINVVVRPNAAVNIPIQDYASQVQAGKFFGLHVEMKNVGSNTWTAAAGYGLAPAAGFQTWGITKIPLLTGDSIAPGATKVFFVQALAPTTPGNYTLCMQMEQGTSLFGDTTAVIPITVTP